MTGRTGWESSTGKIRLLYSRHLRGAGIELGPGHHPYVITLPLTSVRYVDRWDPEQNRALFPELGEEAEFPPPDVRANLDAERLGMFADVSQDFVIASHVFEHLANPMAMLVESHRVLKPGGVLVLLLPDMRLISDAGRPPTTVEHLVQEYRTDVREVDDAHLLEYVRLVRRYEGDDADKLEELLGAARMRSVHVHCWTEESFFPVLEHAVAELGCAFDILELAIAGDIPGSKEFGYVLRRPAEPAAPGAERERLVQTRELMLRARFAQSELATRKALHERDRQLALVKSRLARRDAQIDRIRRLPIFPIYRAGRRLQLRITGRRADGKPI